MVGDGPEDEPRVAGAVSFHEVDVEVRERGIAAEKPLPCGSGGVCRDIVAHEFVGHPAPDEEIGVNRRDCRGEHALHLALPAAGALEPAPRGARHAGLGGMERLLEAACAHHGLALVVEDFSVHVGGHEPDARAVEVDSGIPRTVDIFKFPSHELSCVI